MGTSTNRPTRPTRRPASRPAGQATNLAVLRGTVTSGPTRRTLASGSDVVQFDLATSVRGPDGTPVTTSAPVSWYAPSPAAETAVQPGQEIVVIGAVSRRFFRVGGATQSRTEVVAREVIPARRRAAVSAALARASDALSGRDG